MAFVLTSKKIPIISDDGDEALLLDGTWSISSHGYARKKKDGKQIYLHRLILGMSSDDKRVVDHINGNRLDNRRENLRLCTAKENSFNQRVRSTNKSGFKGVSWIERDRHWRAAIGVNGKKVYLGAFQTAELAHSAYIEAAARIHGQFANLT